MTRELELREVAVVGGGIMGAGIAAFFANNGIPSKIFDVKLELAKGAIDKLADPKAKIPLLYTTKYAERIKAFAIDDYAKELKSADMIVEVVPEMMALKQKVFPGDRQASQEGVDRRHEHLGPLGQRDGQGCSEDMQEHFRRHALLQPGALPAARGAHPLQEGAERLDAAAQGLVRQDRQAADHLQRHAELRRQPHRHLHDDGDPAVDGQVRLLGGGHRRHHRAAARQPQHRDFQTCGHGGIDTLMHASKNSYDNCPNDEARDTCKPPAFLTKMVEQKMLGDKTQKGFYAKTPDKKILALDLKTFEYHDRTEPRFDCVRAAKGFSKANERVHAMMTYGAEDKVSKFSRELVLGSAAYALNRVGEVANDIPTIDNALKWGFAKEVGPSRSWTPSAARKPRG